MSETPFVWAGTACYALATLILIARIRLHSQTYGLLWLGVACLSTAIAVRWIELGQGPFMTLYEVLLSSGFSLGLVYAVITMLLPATKRCMPLVLPFLLMMMIWALKMPDRAIPLPPTFDNFWLWIHLFSGKIFLGTLLTAVSLSCILLFQSIRKVNGGTQQVILEQDSLIWRLASVAFVFDSFMLLAGAVWAHFAWGRYWAWDPLETWAFITWLLLGMLLHARLTFKMPLWAGWAGTVLVFVIAFLTFFGVPFFSHSVHKGVM